MRTIRRGIAGMLVIMLLAATLIFSGTVSASTPATLYAGGGAIYATDWTDKGNSIYEGSGILPTPIMPGAIFEGWYTNPELTDGKQLAGAGITESKYYAKWTNVLNDSNGSMLYQLTWNGGTANGINGSEKISAFFNNGGFYTAYMTTVPAAGGGDGSYAGTAVRFHMSATDDMYVNLIGTDAYIARTMNLEGGLVRLTYHVQNRGSSKVSGLSIGAAADAQLGNNDHVALVSANDGNYKYLAMRDTAVGKELRLLYSGASITTPNRLWWGGYRGADNKNRSNFVENAFNNNKDGKYKDGIDSALAFSWTGISVNPGETKSYSVLLGVGTSSSFNMNNKLTYNLNGATGNAPVDSNLYPMGAEVTLTSTVPVRKGYNFACWSTAPDGSNSSAKAGGKLPMYGDTTVYAIWEAAPLNVALTVTEDGVPLANVIVDLYKNGRKYTSLSHISGGEYNGIVTVGNYDVYVNGIKHSQVLTVEEHTTKTIEFRTAIVELTLDDSALAGHSVALYKEGVKFYDLTEQTKGTFKKGLLEDGTYEISLDGVRSGEFVTVGTTKTLAYYTAEVTVKKDDKAWTDANVIIGSEKAALSGGKYTLIVPKGTYAVKVNGEELGELDGNYAFSDANYYTVTFYDGPVPYGTSTSQKPQIVRSGELSIKPEQNPIHSGGSAVFDGWKDKDGAEFKFEETITKTTGIYASWSTPIVVPGAISKADVNKYKLPDLKITGYTTEKISGFTVAITGGGSVADSGTGNTKVGSGTANLSVSFGSAKTIADAETYLRDLVFTVGTSKQTVTITVFGN